MNTSFTPPANATLRRLTVTCLSAALLLFTSLQSMAQVIPASPLCGFTQTAEYANTTPVVIPTTAPPNVVTSTIVVSGASPYLFDLNVLTFIQHTFSGDLDITLTSPAGTVVTLTTDNGAGNDNVFNGTLWDDDADPDGQVPYTNNDGLVTDHLYTNLTLASPLVPEEAFGAFIGEDPNGTWTLTISDDADVDGGSLDQWALQVTSLQSAPPTFFASFSDAPAAAISDVGTPTVTATINVSGLHPYLFDLNVITNISHTFSSDLNITLTSPAGTVVTLVTFSGTPDIDDVYAGTTWDDDANPGGQVPYTSNNGLAADNAYADLTVATPLAPEEALAAFIGEDPNGVWTLTIYDEADFDGGTLNSWQLDITQVGDETVPAITCPSNITQSNDAGFCDAVVTYTAPVGTDNCEVVTLTQSYDNSTITAGNSVSCNALGLHADNSYYRVYDLPALGYTSDFFVHSVDFGIEEAIGAGGSQPAVVNIYTLSGPFTLANLTLIASEAITVPDQTLSVFNAPIEATIPAGSTLVVELFTPDGQVAGNSFFIGSNANGQSAPGYIVAATCGVTVPTSSITISANMNIILDVNAGSLTTLTSGLGSGATFAVGGPYTETYTVTDLSGNSTSCSFDITIEDNEAPVITSCPGDATADNATGTCGAVVTYAAATATDNCPGTTINYSQASGTVFPVGVTTVTVTAEDGAGNTDVCTFTVTVNDIDGPVVSCTDFQLFDNGPVVNSPGTGAGGADESVLQNTSLSMSTIGFGHQVTANNRVADDFTVNSINGWTIDEITFYAYQTGSTTTSTITAVNLRIWDGVPGVGNIVYGDGATNLMTSTEWTGAYRVTETTNGNTTRPIMKNTVSLGGVFLPAGTYWLDWQTDGTLGSGPWAMPVTINGQATTGNGMQSIAGGAFAAVVDGGTGTGQGFPFQIFGTTDLTYANSAGVCEATVDLPLPTAEDCSDITSVINDYNGTSDASDTYPVGTTTVNWTFTDAAGNSSTCSYDVVVEDTEAPAMSCIINPPVCDTYTSTDVPVTIPTTAATVTSQIVIADAGAITDLNVSALNITHTFVSDLLISLTSPSGTTVVLMDNNCFDEDDIDIQFDDAGLTSGTYPCPPVDGLAYAPDELLSAFNGENLNGTWTLTVEDRFDLDGGTIDGWSLDICYGGDNLIFASADPSVCEAFLAISAPVFSDNCPGVIISNDYNNTSDASDIYPIGTTTVTWTALDLAGNFSTCTMEITVEDNEFPVITCPGDIAADNDAGVCGAVVSYTAPSISDNCDITPLVTVSGAGASIPDDDIAGTTITQPVAGLTGNVLGTDVFLQSVCLDVTHTWVGDLTLTLVSPGGASVTLVDRPGYTGSGFGCSRNNIDACFEAGTGNEVEGVCDVADPTISGTFTAANGGDLNAINNGDPANGTWTLFASDAGLGDLGAVNNWTLTFLDVNGVATAIQVAGLPSGSVFPVGTTTNTFEITDASGNTSTCSFDVVISDVEGPALACPDVTVDNDAGLCSAVVNYTEPVGVDACEPLMVTQSLSQDIIFLNSISCNDNVNGHADNSYMRVFDLAAMGYTNDFYINSVDIGIEDAFTINGTQPVTLNLYSLTGPLTFANLTLLATESLTVPDQSLTILNVPLTNQLTVPAGTTLVMEVFTPNGQVDGNFFFMGSNSAGQTGLSYLASTDCSIPEPSDVATPIPSISYPGFPGIHWVMNLNAGSLTEFVSGTGTGGTFPVGTTTETYQSTDVFGNVTTCSFDVIVNDVEIPVITCLADPPVSNTYASSDVPVAVVDEGDAVSTITISDHGAITDLNVLNLTGTHTWVSDLTFTLTSPAGTDVVLFSGTCSSADDYNINFDDAGAANGTWPCGPVGGGGTYVSNDPLSAFNGEDIFGTWTLTMSDGAAGDVGDLNSWTLATSVAGSPHVYYQSNDAGQCGANVTVDVPVFSDNCAVALTNDFNGTADASDFYPVGVTTVTFTATDASGNSASCEVIVNVSDDEDPVITCPADIFADNDAGQCGAVVTYSLPAVSDNCPIPAVLAFDGAALVIPDGDPAGASVSQTVSGITGTQLGTDVFLQSVCLDVSHTWVEDLQFVLVSPNGDVITLMDGSLTGCSGDDLDVCFVPGTGNELSGGTCSNLPAYSGDFSAESADLGALSAGTDPNGVWTLYATDFVGFDNGAINGWTLTFLDQNGVPAPIQVAGLPSGSEFPVGTTTNTYEVTDAAGNTVSCSFDVVISDVEGPALTCPADITQSNDAGICGAVVTYTVPVGVDNCDPFTVTHSLSQASPSGFGIACNTGGLVTANRFARVFDVDAFGFTGGMHVTGVQFGIDDATAGIGGTQPAVVNLYSLSGPMSISNLTLIASQPVSIPDQSGSIMTVPIDATVPGGTLLVYELTVPDGTGSGHTFFMGANAAGETGISWIQAPVCGANDFTDLATLVPNTALVMNVLAGSLTEQTDGTGLTSGDEFPVGTTVQEYTSTDVYGNTTVCSFNVTVNDTEAPVFSVCPADTIGCESSPVIVYATPTASDNCPGMTLTQTAGLPSGSTFPPGVTTNVFTATDAAGNVTTCSFDVTITANPVVDFTYFPTCIGEIIYFTSSATVDPALGTSIVSYEWEFSDGSGTNLDVNPTHVYNVAGDYVVTLTVTTNWGCQTTVSHTVTVHPTPTMTLTPQDALCNGDANGSVTVDVTVGDAPIDYSINGGPATSSGTNYTFTGLAAGNYQITITDVNGCSASSAVTVGEPAVLVGSVVSTTDVVCFGQASGGAEVAATGGTPAYSYSVDGGASQGSGVFTGLTGGNHVVTITDANGCTATVTVTVAEPDEIIVDATSQPVLCNGDATGSIDVTATGGVGTLQYSNDGGATFQATGSFSGLAAGTYVVVVQDANGCSVSEGVTIAEPAEALSGTADVQNVSCMGDASGAITIDGNGGTGAYQYSIDGGTNWQPANTFTDLAAGDYTITVMDANGCTADVNATVLEPASALSLTTAVTQVTCNGAGDGQIDATGAGGDAPYEYSFNAGVTWQASGSFTNLAPGTYTIMLRDSNMCSVAATAVVTQPAVLTVTETASADASCEGQADGSFTATAAGGTGPYTYTSNGNSNSTGVFSNVAAGNYLVNVTDASGCSASVAVSVGFTNPLPVAAFNWFASGSVVQFSNQSVDGVSYAWDFGDGSTSTDQNPVHTYAAQGTYTVTLVVTNACGTDTITWVIDTNHIGINDPDADANALTVYPNPNHGQFTVNYTGTGIIGQIQVNIMTVEGRLVMAEQFTINADTFIRNYSDIELAAGVYMVQFISEKSTVVKRITVDK